MTCLTRLLQPHYCCWWATPTERRAAPNTNFFFPKGKWRKCISVAPQPWLFQRQKTSKPNKEQMSAHSLLPTSEIDLRSGGIKKKKRASCHGLDRDDIRQRWRTSCYNTRSSINAVASPVISSLLKQSISSPRPRYPNTWLRLLLFYIKTKSSSFKKIQINVPRRCESFCSSLCPQQPDSTL